VQQIMIITGLTGAFLANYALAHTAGSSTAEFWLGLPAWRWMFWLQVVPRRIYLLALLAIPESPRFLVAKGRDAEAEAVLSKLFGDAGARKVAEIRASLAADHKPKLQTCSIQRPARCARSCGPADPGGVPATRRHQHRLLLRRGAVAVGGLLRERRLKINILSGALSILACLGAIAVIDRIGRKPLLLIGSAAWP
jgi:SP family sugar:H+ symporter-like MFS transporter